MGNENKFNCPKCGSDNTASIPLVYKRGHATGNATHQEVVGYYVSQKTTTYADGHKETEDIGHSPVYGEVYHPTYTETDLAGEIAPPQQPKMPVMEADGSFICGVKGLTAFYISYVVFTPILAFIQSALQMTHATKGLIFCLISLSIIGVSAYGLYQCFDKAWCFVSGKKRRFDQAMIDYDEAMEQYRKNYEVWEHFFICMRCGHKFYVE